MGSTRSIRRREIFDCLVEERFGEISERSQIYRILRDIEDAAYQSSDGDPYRYEERLGRGAEIVQDLREAVSEIDYGGRADERSEALATLIGHWQQNGTLWMPPNVQWAFSEGTKSRDWRLVSRDQVREVAQDILEQSWLRSDELEWVVCNILITQEAQAWGDEVKKGTGQSSILKSVLAQQRFDAAAGNVGKMTLRSLPIALLAVLVRIGLAVLAIGVGATVASDSYTSSFTGTLVALVTAWLLHRLLVGRPTADTPSKTVLLLSEMQSAANHLNWGGTGLAFESIVAVRRLQLLLDRSTANGAGWDAAALAIVDRAAMGPEPFWRLFRRHSVLRSPISSEAERDDAAH